MLMVLVSVSCASSDDSEIFEFAVGPEIRDCVGVAPMRCMVGNGELFYDAIEGFDYVEGFDYLLRVERYDAWPDQEEPPRDASRYGYRLIEVISKTRQDAARRGGCETIPWAGEAGVSSCPPLPRWLVLRSRRSIRQSG